MNRDIRVGPCVPSEFSLGVLKQMLISGHICMKTFRIDFASGPRATSFTVTVPDMAGNPRDTSCLAQSINVRIYVFIYNIYI